MFIAEILFTLYFNEIFDTKVNVIFLSQTHGITREVELFILLSTDLGLNPQLNKKLAASPDLVTLWLW